jgi:hypothetical protein
MPNKKGNNNNNKINQMNEHYYNKNHNGFSGNYYIDPYCAADGHSIYLGVYYDPQCINQVAADDISSVIGDQNHGATLPYSDKSLVLHKDCLACSLKDMSSNQNGNSNNNNNNNNNGNNDITPLCEFMYKEAVKCETKNTVMGMHDTSGCTLVNDIFPARRKETSMKQSTSYSTNAKQVSSGGGGNA